MSKDLANFKKFEKSRRQGAGVDAKDVRKHRNDVLRLSQLLAPAMRIPLAQKMRDDTTRGRT